MDSQINPYNMTAICYANIALSTKLDGRCYASDLKSCMGKYRCKKYLWCLGRTAW